MLTMRNGKPQTAERASSRHSRVAWSTTTVEAAAEHRGEGATAATAHPPSVPSRSAGATAARIRVVRSRSLDAELSCGARWSGPPRAANATNPPASQARQSRQSAVSFSVDVELADTRDLFKARHDRGTAKTAGAGPAGVGVSESSAPEIVRSLVDTAKAAASAREWSRAIDLYQEALAHTPGDKGIQQLLLAAIKNRANPYTWLPAWLSAGTADGHPVKPNVRDPHHFQSPAEYRDFDPQDIDAGLVGYGRLLRGCIYDFADDKRFVKVLAALVLICIYDCAIPVVLQHLFDNWIPGKDKDNIFWMLFSFAISYPAYLYAHSWVISKPLDQVFVRNRLFRHALKMPWAFWNFQAAEDGRTVTHGQLSAGGNTANDAMVTSLITEDCNVVMDATCTAFDAFYTLIHLTCICALVIAGLKLPLTIAVPPLTVHLFTFVAIDFVAPRFLYHTAMRQLEYERCVKEVQESVRGVHALRLFNGEGHSTQRMLTRLIDFDTHHFAAVKLRWQIEQLPDIIAQVLRLCTLAWGSLLLVYHENSMTVGSLVGLLAALTSLAGDFTSLAKHTMSLTRARPSLQRIYRFLESTEDEEPSPQSVVRRNDTLQRTRSRTEMLLARMDADPIVLITECSFSYGTWLLANRGPHTFEIESDGFNAPHTLARRGYLHIFLAMAGILIILMMTTVASIDLDLAADVDPCRYASNASSLDGPYTFRPAAPNDDDLAELPRILKPENLVIATYAGTVVFLTCGFVYFVKQLSGLGWCQVINWQESESTALRSSLAKHQKMTAEIDFMGDVRQSSHSNQSIGDRFSRRNTRASRRHKRASEIRDSTHQSRRTSFTSVGEDLAILQDLSMAIHRGELVVLCGEAAFGKTTIFRLLTKMTGPETGRVHIHLGIGGVVAGIEQETFIFDTSIFENIRVGHPPANRKLVRSAARAAGIHSKRDLTTACGVGGKLLSPAEAQRIGIARGYLRVMTAPDPSESLLVLDDPFSFQDPHSAAHITSHLRDLVAHGTSVVVLTQQTQLCAAADTVFLLEAGKLKASGTHEDMLRNQSLYSRIHSISQSFSISSTGSVTRVRASGLENYWIFAGLKPAERAAVAKAFEPQHFPAGHVIYELPSDEEAPFDHTGLHQLCIVTRGQVELVVGEMDQRAVAVYGVGQIFGPNLSLMNLDEYSQIRCSKPTDVIALDTCCLELLCQKFTALQQAFSTCRELRSELGTNEHLRQLWRGFEMLTDIELEEVRALLATEVYSVGVQVCRQGQEVGKLLLVVRGEVELEYGNHQKR